MNISVQGKVLCLMILVGTPIFSSNVSTIPRQSKYVVDRFEGDSAVLLLSEDETIEKLIPKKDLIPSISEGDILLVNFNSEGKVFKSERLTEETNQARKQVFLLLNNIKNK